MQLFYTRDIQGKIAELPETEARHCVQVLRHRVGDQLNFVDGKGGWYEGEIIHAGKKSCTLSILKEEVAYNARDFYLHIAIAPTKSIDRFEWFLEKATEIGIDEITPLLCHQSERKRVRQDRLEKVLLSAMKQSLRAYLPKLNALTPIKQFLQQPERAGQEKFIAHCQNDQLAPLQENYSRGKDVMLLIGPEGDFASSEIEQCLQLGFQPVSLGKHRLRTETAGIVACHSLNFLNE